MCDPILIGYGLMAATAAYTGEKQRKAASQARTEQRELIAKAETDRQDAEAKAAQRAQSEIAQTTRRRQRQTLMSSGEPVPYATSPLTEEGARKGKSLMSKGALV